ncbi:MAG: ABC transporter ATP-binding protein [Lentisphaeria bacterium]|nr:ABC transporter ATP-binding protein [Lentisphaeria bacterium]
MSAPAVQAQGVTRVYRRSDGDVHALAGVDLTIAMGETVAITGPSGCGKSTLLSLIAGLDRPSDGHLDVLGRTLEQLSEDELADLRRHHMGFVFQNYHLIPTLTVCENVMLPLIPQMGQSLELKAKALHCIERVGLERRINHIPGELSGGEQQRVGLARALVTEPTLILADEPTGNLDADSADSILELLFRVAGDRQRTLILTTHDRNVAGRCGREIRFLNGAIAP